MTSIAFICLPVSINQVTMTDRDGAERACNVPNPMVDGRKANVNLAYLGAKRKSPKNQPG